MLKSKVSVARGLLAAFVAPWVLDMRSQQGLEWLHYYQALSFLISSFVFLLILMIFQKRISLKHFAGNAVNIAVVVNFWFFSFCSGLVEGNDIVKLFSFSVPFFLFTYSLIIISVFAQAAIRITDVLDVIISFAVATIIIHFPLAVFLYHLNLDVVRYQILSGATAVGSAYILSRLLSGYRIRDLFFAIAQMSILLLSVTRISLLSLGAMVVVLVFSLPQKMNKWILTAGFSLTLGILCALLLATQLPGNPLNRWLVRAAPLRGEGVDMSAIARESQILFEIDKLRQPGIERFIGFGLAAPGGELPIMAATEISRGMHPYLPVGFPDHTYVAFLFLGGLIGGGPILLMQFVWFWNAYRAARWFLSNNPRARFWYVVAPLAIVGYQVENLASVSFIYRSASVYFGLLLGITSWVIVARQASSTTSSFAPGKDTGVRSLGSTARLSIN